MNFSELTELYSYPKYDKKLFNHFFQDLALKYGYPSKKFDDLFNLLSAQELKNLYKFYKTLWSFYLSNNKPQEKYLQFEFPLSIITSHYSDEKKNYIIKNNYKDLINIPNKDIAKIRWILLNEMNKFANSKLKEERDFIVWGFREFFEYNTNKLISSLQIK